MRTDLSDSYSRHSDACTCGCVASSCTTYTVVAVNHYRNPLDTHAAPTLREALELAMPDARDLVCYGTVTAPDAGAARLVPRNQWTGGYRNLSRRAVLKALKGES